MHDRTRWTVEVSVTPIKRPTTLLQLTLMTVV
ncbi:MAG: hypothetical protein JWQ55_3473 [Rhodopila sp.]|nr:hypothetical protein [Rhodopila sp.]